MGDSMIRAGLGISVSNVRFAYDGHKILDDIKLHIPKGTFSALLGPNGAGKSTLLKVISGYLEPQQGEVLVCDKRVHSMKDRDRSRLITYVAPDYRSSFEFTVEEAVMMGRIPHSDSLIGSSARDIEAAERAMLATKIIHLRDRPVTALSSGEQQRVQIARAICQEPEVLLLDEPTAHLDMSFELEMMDILGQLVGQGRTVLAVFHDVNLALRNASTLFFLKQGELVESIHPDRISPEIIEKVYGVKARILEDSGGKFRCVVPYSLAGSTDTPRETPEGRSGPETPQVNEGGFPVWLS
ncbi:MAG: ABC transporter ATP-binding protein [Bacillota bacterium]|nr:ABC transporter ATP-binding protein [Candidatus Fermentithermobacillaceae bacterium]